MTIDEQIDQVCRSSINHVRNLFKIRKFLNENSPSKVVHAFITTRLGYCNHLYFGLPKYKVKSLQLIQNTAARFVTNVKKHEHITPTLVQLDWLPVSYRIVFKHIFVYKALNSLCPEYLAELLLHRKSIRTLRSNPQDLLMQQTSRTKTYGDRAFAVCAPKIWNTLSLNIRNSSTVPVFRGNLKLFFLIKLLRVIL